MIVKVFTSWVERLSMTATITLFVAFIIIVIVLGVGFSPPGKTAIRTSFFVTQILDLPIKPQTWFADTPVREKVMYPGPNGELVSDVYSLTGHEPRPGILLFLGANAAGRDDPDVIRLGEALARAGFIVMFHCKLHSIKEPTPPRKSNSWMIFSRTHIVFVVIAGIVFVSIS